MRCAMIFINRLAAMFLLVGAANLAVGVRHEALVIGVAHYDPRIEAAPGFHKQEGVGNDAAYADNVFGRLLRFQSTPLRDADAKRDRILEWIRTRAKDASEGDEYVVYFSGLGSVMRSGGRLVPSLVPYDGRPDSGDGDIAVDELQGMARLFAARKAHIAFVIDASYVAPPVARDFETKQWKSIPRCLTRGAIGAEALPATFEPGPGTIMAACSPRGSAWEVRNNLSEWQGAFTFALFEELYSGLEERLTSAELMTRVAVGFRAVVERNNLAGQDPAPPQDEASEDYARPPFTTQTPDRATFPLLARVLQARRERRQKLLLCVSFDGALTGQVSAATQSLERSLKTLIPNLALVTRGQMPDRVVRLAPDLKTMTLVEPESSGKDRAFTLDGAGDAGLDALATRLKLGWVCLEIYRTIVAAPGPWGTSLQIEPSKPRYQIGDRIGLTFRSPKPGCLFALSRQDADGVLDKWFPHPADTRHDVPAGASEWDAGYELDKDSPAGRSDLFALVLPATFPWSLPPSKDLLAGIHSEGEAYARLDRALLPLAEKIRDWIQDPKNDWGMAKTHWWFSP